MAWGNAPKSTINRLALMQKKAIRYIANASYNSHTEPLLKKLNILNIWDLHEYEVTLFMYKFVNHTLPQSFEWVYSFNYEIQADRVTRQSSLMHIKRCDSTFARRLPLYTFPVIWNQWSTSVDGHISLNHMKKIVKSSLLNKYAQNVKCKNPRCKDYTPQVQS